MTPLILTWTQIDKALADVDVVAAMEAGFDAYSNGLAVIPPVGELLFEHPPGDVHIKYGYLRNGQHYVVKIASGFYDNPKLGLPSSQGLMLLFEQQTGQLSAVLLDEGRLTDIRTGAAGAAAAKHLAPSDLKAIGVLGTGIQAREQLAALRAVTDCRDVVAWGRHPDHLAAYVDAARTLGFSAEPAEHPSEVADRCRLLITTTPSREPLLRGDWIHAGTHITAVGADSPQKQELDISVLAKADHVIADSLSQCQSRGEIHHALAAKAIDPNKLIELGNVIAGRVVGRKAESDITVTDLTGIAVQDLQIAAAVVNKVA